MTQDFSPLIKRVLAGVTYNRNLRVGLSLLYSINSSMSKSHLGILGLQTGLFDQLLGQLSWQNISACTNSNN